MDTICAIATARASAAIGVIRVSGDRAIEICGGIIRARHGEFLKTGGCMYMGLVCDGDMPVDEVLYVVFPAPRSYTGEDVVEINCHGGVAVLDRVMRLLIKNGARAATGGEFTKRAFLNGKMDLIQAEAVADLIASGGEQDAALALRQMSGRLSSEITQLFDMLVSLNTDILAYVDFPDEGLSDVSPQRVISELEKIKARLLRLENSFNTGSVIRDGVDTVIIGMPNVGKSALLNALLGYERAIVSDTAGTTRDMITERATVGGVTLNLCDTAGMHDAENDIERRGIELAKAHTARAGLVLAVIDGSRPLTEGDTAVLELAASKPTVVIINKSDLPQRAELKSINAGYTVSVSAKSGAGMDELCRAIEQMFLSDRASIESGMLLSNARQYDCVVKARRLVESAQQTLEDGFTPDLASVDITDAASSLGMITGNAVSDRIIDEIFSKFCVGK